MTYMYNSILNPYISTFLSRQKSVVSKFTYQHECGVLSQFDQYISAIKCDNCNFTEHQILDWIASINLKNSTKNSYITIIRSFFKFLSGYGFHPFMPDYIKYSYDYMAYAYTDEQIEILFKYADNLELYPNPKAVNRPHPSRRYELIQYELPMILRLLFGCGLRLEEATTLKYGDIDFQNGVLIIRKTKSKEYRIVPVDSSLTTMLERYCAAIGVGINCSSYIFPGLDFSAPIPSYCLRNYFNRVLRETGISLPGRKKHERGPCLHCFRHAFAHRSFKKGEKEAWAINDQIPWLSVYLGHRNLKETQKYLNYNIEMYSEEVDCFETYSDDFYPEVSFDE